MNTDFFEQDTNIFNTWKQNHVERHLNMFGNTSRIRAGEPIVDRKSQIGRLERIHELIYWCEMELDEYNKHLKNKDSFYNLFDRVDECRDKLRIAHYQRDRLFRIWNKQLDKMKSL